MRAQVEFRSREDLAGLTPAPVRPNIPGVIMGRRGYAPYELQPRASRYAVAIPVRYRRQGELGWVETKTVNLSSSGIVFQVDSPLKADTALELTFDAPPEVGGGQITCRGQVVRTILAPATEELPTVAATIKDFCIKGN